MSVGGGQQTLADMDDTVLIVKWQSQWVVPRLKRKRRWSYLTFSWNLSRSKAVMANMLAPGGHTDTTFTPSNRLSVLSLPCHRWAFAAWRIYGDANFFHPVTADDFEHWAPHPGWGWHMASCSCPPSHVERPFWHQSKSHVYSEENRN